MTKKYMFLFLYSLFLLGKKNTQRLIFFALPNGK